jgi:integrase
LSVRGNDDCEYVFVSNIKGKIKQLNPATLNKWSKGLFTEILGRRFHPHILREARATSLVVEGGKDIKVVQKLLGHNSPQTSEIYVIRNDEDMSDEAFT